MKVLHICYANKGGGGAIGAYRLHTTMLSQGVDSRLLVMKKGGEDPTVIRAPFVIRAASLISRNLGRYILKLQQPADHSYRSMNIFPTGIWRVINSIDADIIQMHWINGNTVGISEFKHIRKPIVWKLPDMWAFSGCEHYPINSTRPFSGYRQSNKVCGARGLDIDRFVWTQKKHHWKDLNLTIVAPSKWLADCAKSSYLFKRYSVYNIPNPVNLDIYRPAVDTVKVREYLKLPLDNKLILFASLTSHKDPRKGFDFLEKCISRLAEKVNPNDYKIVIMGYYIPNDSIGGIEVINMGYLAEELNVAMAYSAMDVCAVPSYADNLPNTIKESMACGTPCVAFDTGGVPDMITHKLNGYLAPVNDIDEFCNGLIWILTGNYPAISKAARDAAHLLHNPRVIVKKYLDVYENILASKNV